MLLILRTLGDHLERDERSVVDSEVWAVHHGSKIVERMGGNVSNGAELSRRILRRQASTLDLVPFPVGVDGVMARSRATGAGQAKGVGYQLFRVVGYGLFVLRTMRRRRSSLSTSQ